MGFVNTGHMFGSRNSQNPYLFPGDIMKVIKDDDFRELDDILSNN